MIYLDTHVVVWLYAGEINRIPGSAQLMIEKHDLVISPMVILELEYLYEIKRISVNASVIVESLEASIGLQVCKLSFHRLVSEAIAQNWTRDPFDRMIAANAVCAKSRLLTKDETILNNCNSAFWE